MAQIAKRKHSGSTDGRQIKVVQTVTPGTLIHTAVAGTVAGTLDEIWVYAANSDTAARTLTIQWGGTTAPDDSITLTLGAQSGLVLVIPGLVLQNGSVVRAFASVANVLTIAGFVNAITQ